MALLYPSTTTTTETKWSTPLNGVTGLLASVRCIFYTVRYAYDTGPENPGQLKVSLSGVPVDGDYWLAGLGPQTFGPEGLYEWAIVTGP